VKDQNTTLNELATCGSLTDRPELFGNHYTGNYNPKKNSGLEYCPYCGSLCRRYEYEVKRE
jgi:hypothetical protein